ncbi:hypothetical protein SY83_20560 [Paenibacillus swuensis]|uniref:Uncharacterized protein n=1 Tax=Paenibacillus swuensis TaxID=1178515 RepID=A0A172TML2_9BACL|nr:hypothetical protein SY83_20560 [Paenibacillus swuensis]
MKKIGLTTFLYNMFNSPLDNLGSNEQFIVFKVKMEVDTRQFFTGFIIIKRLQLYLQTIHFVGKGAYHMAKRIPPVMQHQRKAKEEVNKKALIWSAASLSMVVVLVAILLILDK